MRGTRRRTIGAAAVIVALLCTGALAGAASPGQGSGTSSGARAAADSPIFTVGDIRHYCETQGGTFEQSQYGWLCTLPNGDEVWCDFVHGVCGYTDRGKPAKKQTRHRLVAFAGLQMQLIARTTRRADRFKDGDRLLKGVSALAKAGGGGAGRGPGRTDTLRATCAKVRELIDGYENVLGGGSIFSGAVDTVPGLRARLQSDLRDAKEFNERVCNDVLPE
jgi:hypothetical protein